jgi:hypothetical protein
VTAEELRAEIAIEFELLGLVVNELELLRHDLAGREPTIRERTAAASFLAQFYTGVENILKRLCRFHGVMLPVGENWHFELFKRFCAPGQPPLPALLNQQLERQLGAFRRFRHVVHHGYGFQIDWDRMRDGIIQVNAILAELRRCVSSHLDPL